VVSLRQPRQFATPFRHLHHAIGCASIPRVRAPTLLLFIAMSGSFAWACATTSTLDDAANLPPIAESDLRSPADFATIRDEAQRSSALFGEMNRVLSHARCANCHPQDGVPRQGDQSRFHDPMVEGGEDNHGLTAMECTSCHQETNLALARVPGAPGWHLAPVEMAWLGKTPAHICEQIKDPARNGKKTLAQIVEHLAHDKLVAWGWAPGHGRTPAPGTQAKLRALAAAWVDSGAHCPKENAR